MTIANEKRGRRILVIDVCGTLYDTNTTAGFCRFHHARVGNHFRSSLIWLVSVRTSPLRWALVALERIVGRDLHRWLTVRSLRGASIDQVNVSAEAYVKGLLLCRIEPVWKLIDELRRQDPDIYLVSNAVDPVVSAVARGMGVKYLSSRLEWNGHFCTGRIYFDTTGCKKSALEKMIVDSLDNIHLTVITDNRSDGDLLNAADRPIIVYKGRRKSWSDFYNAEFIGHD